MILTEIVHYVFLKLLLTNAVFVGSFPPTLSRGIERIGLYANDYLLAIVFGGIAKLIKRFINL